MFYRRAFRPLLFAQDPETAHERTIEMLSTAGQIGLPFARRPYTHARLRVSVAGLSFPNPVGLAAGCDKNARAVAVWPRFGFGFVEVGTVTAQPQPGNAKPRLFRLPEHRALINRLGFNSEGSEVVARRLARLQRHGRTLPVPLAVNIGKTKRVSGDEETLEDYRTSFRRLAPLADLLVVNVSSPNTPGLRQWQERDRLAALLAALMAEGRALAVERGLAPAPLFVKISPDMAEADMDDVVEVALEQEIAGIVATNTTIAREGALTHAAEEGGLSGRPLCARATEVVRYLYRRLEGRLPIIGVGGIFTPEDAYARLQAGASLLQLYTGLIYEGPFLPRTLNTGLLRLMERDGVRHVTDLVGVAAR